MKVIVAGSRGITDKNWVFDRLNDEFQEFERLNTKSEIMICSGMARGVDTYAVEFAATNGYGLLEFPAKWDELGMGAGFARNEEMAKNADHLIAFWDGQSRGTWDMVERAVSHGLWVKVYRNNGGE